jgi:pimeloyl-ACP methyl ester carboxylesterase
MRAGIHAHPVPYPRPTWLPESVWPFQTSALHVDGTRIAITDIGHGPAVVFVHTGFWSFIWREVMLRLAGEFRCICFDPPGTGQSDRLPASRISLDRAARTLTEIVETLDLDQVTLAFHDLGGLSGIAGAARVADRIGALCAVNAFAWKPEGLAFRGMLSLMGSTAMAELDARLLLLPRVAGSPFGVGRHFEERAWEAFVAGIGPQGVRAFHAYMRDAARGESIYDDVDSALAGPLRRLPLATVFGERNDPFGFQLRWKKLFPLAKQFVVPRGNHFPMCDDPDLVAKVIRGLW